MAIPQCLHHRLLYAPPPFLPAQEAEAGGLLQDPLPAELLQVDEEGPPLPGLLPALRAMHSPANEEEREVCCTVGEELRGSGGLGCAGEAGRHPQPCCSVCWAGAYSLLVGSIRSSAAGPAQ